MNASPLIWSEPAPTGWATVEATDGTRQWRIVPVPRDVARIHYSGRDADGTIVASTTQCAHAESAEEAMIVVDALRSDTDAMPGWQEQLEAAGFVRTYPDDDGSLAGMWHDERSSGRYGIDVRDGFAHTCGSLETSVDATYESDGSTFWHNVCRVDAGEGRSPIIGGVRCRGGLPEGVDALKAGVAAAIAIRDARTERGGRFSMPLGGQTKSRKRA